MNKLTSNQQDWLILIILLILFFTVGFLAGLSIGS